jgi:DNA invertase Pin-like site-specific DNA recombinase
MRDEGKEAVTVWLSHDAKLRLEDLASVWHSTTSAMVEQALAHFHPGNPPHIGNATDIAQIQALMQDMVRAILPELKEQMLQELRGDMAVAAMNGNVTVTEAADTPAAPYERGKNKLTPLQAAEMRGKRAAGTPIKALVEEYGISKATYHRYKQEPEGKQSQRVG